MDAKTIYTLMKPHLDLMEPTERASLSSLIAGKKDKKKPHVSRRMLTIAKAKEKLRSFRKKEMAREKP